MSVTIFIHFHSFILSYIAVDSTVSHISKWYMCVLISNLESPQLPLQFLKRLYRTFMLHIICLSVIAVWRERRQGEGKSRKNEIKKWTDSTLIIVTATKQLLFRKRHSIHNRILHTLVPTYVKICSENQPVCHTKIKTMMHETPYNNVDTNTLNFSSSPINHLNLRICYLKHKNKQKIIRFNKLKIAKVCLFSLDCWQSRHQQQPLKHFL